MQIEDTQNEASFQFTTDFIDKDREIYKKQVNPYAKTMQLIDSLLKNYKAKDILVVCDDDTKNKLGEDLEHFIKDETILFNSSEHIIYQNSNGLQLVSFSQIASLRTKIAIILGTHKATKTQLEYAINLSTEKTYILYDQDNENITYIDSKYRYIN